MPVNRSHPWDAQVIVAGAGAWGSMAAWRLAAAGAAPLVLDSHSPPHQIGSSHGLTRLFRTACLEHPDLTPIALRSLELYRELEQLGGQEILDLCGGLTIGPSEGTAVPGVLAAAARAGIAVDVLDAAAVADRFPFHTRLRSDDLGVVDPLSGALRIETAIELALTSAVALGTDVRTGVEITEITDISGGFAVTTSVGTFRAPKVVAALGSWSKEFFPEIPQKLTRMPMTWFEPMPGAPTALMENTGVFIREIDATGGYWGHGAPAGEPAKVGPRGAVARGDEPTVTGLDRTFTAADAAPAVDMVERYLPTLRPRPSRGFICHSTRTPDEQFVVGEVPGRPGLVVACGESGHGGKHSAGIGDVIADLILERDPALEIEFLSPLRFAS